MQNRQLLFNIGLEGAKKIKQLCTNSQLIYILTPNKDEIIRRYYKALVDFKKGLVDKEVPNRIKILMNELGISENDRIVATKALEKKKSSGKPSACICIGKKYIT